MLTLRDGPGFTGIGCVGGYHSPGTSPLGTRPLLDAEHGLAVLAIQDEHEAGLPDLRERRESSVRSPDIDQPGRGRQVVVPDLVVDVLEVPLPLARLRVERDRRSC